ncbi:MAG TPA: oligogalacturonate lyase family protein [Bryobacteraceae bacterium]|nr:oligogalacturonate lyase family protein [Bryobacteraceae bacterium]
MAVHPRRWSRRSFVISALGMARGLAQSRKGATFESERLRYSDPTTELPVVRLTNPAYSSKLPAYYNRILSRRGGYFLFYSDRSGSPQAYRLDVKSGAIRQLTEIADLDGATLTLTPDNRSFCFFAGRSLYVASLSSLRERKIYTVPEGTERCSCMTVGPDGTAATFAEQRGDTSALRLVTLGRGAARTIIEAPFPIADPIPRPRRAQVLYRQGDQALWLVDSDGTNNRQLKLADGTIGPANWAPDGKTLLYLNFPADHKQLNTIREETPDTNTDKLVAKTSQFVQFGFNHDTSVFVGASRNQASPTVLLLLRMARREFTLCEHGAKHPETVQPMFSPDSQTVYFQSDRNGKSALYAMDVNKLVSDTENEEDEP